MSGYGLIEQLTCVIRLVTEYPQGLSMLLGSVPPPGCEAVNEMLESVRHSPEPTLDPAGNILRVGGGKDYIAAESMVDSEERFNRIIERAGGWEKINEVTREWKKFFPVRWAILVDYGAWVKNSVGNLDGSVLDKVARKNAVGRETVKRVAQLFPQTLAIAILKTPRGENFDLEDVENIKAV
jgi:hypothetical protein